MSKNTVYSMILFIVLVGALGVATKVERVEAGGTIYIRANGDVEGTDKILRDGNMYTFADDIYDSIVVQKSDIIIDGNGYTLQGSGSWGSVGFDLANISNVTIKDTNIDYFILGIYLNSASQTTISRNNITNNLIGVYLNNSFGNTVSGNLVAGGDYGVNIRSSGGNTVSGNNITNNSIYGVRLAESSFNNTVTLNNMTNNYYGVYINTLSFNNTISRNNLKDNSGYGIVLYTSSDNDIYGNNLTNNDCGVYVGNSFDSMVFGNTIAASDDGIFLDHSSNNTISGNNITENDFCSVQLLESSNNTISGNNIANNRCGVSLFQSSNNTISRNDITTNHYYGVNVRSSSNNFICHNNFLNNTDQATCDSDSVNTWDNGYPSGGNFWSDYAGVDLFSGPYQNLTGRDFIGDIPFVINSNNTDRYPLMVPYETEPPTIFILSPENKTYATKDVPLIFTVSESTSWIGYSLDGQINVTISGNITLLDLSEGAHTITVYANDAVGNIGYSDTVCFTIDILPPSIEILSPGNRTYMTSSVSLSFTVDEATSWMGYSLDGQANVTITGKTTLTGLSNGVHSLVVWASDTTGNIGSSIMVYFTVQTAPIDTTPPIVSILSPENKTYDTTDIPLTFTVDESVSWMAYSLDGQANVTITGNTTLTGLSDGSHSLVVYAKDPAGNTSVSQTINFTVENPSPSEVFPIWIVVTTVMIIVVGAAVLVYFKKLGKTTEVK